jgi:superoxide dismutase, Cu-Zn family
VWPTIALLALLGVSNACALTQRDDDPRLGRAVLEGKSGSALAGLAALREDASGVWIELDLYGAPPGEHGVHVRAGRSCGGYSAGAAGPHFNPDRQIHGGPTGTYRHAGDAGNIAVDPAGMGRLEVHLAGVTLGSGPRSIGGRTLVVTQRADDLATQPDGDSGLPIGCGVIQVLRRR